MEYLIRPERVEERREIEALIRESFWNVYGRAAPSCPSRFGIRYHDLDEGEDASFFLCRELIPGYLSGVTGVYRTPEVYFVQDADIKRFDSGFAPKEKKVLPGQIF